MFTINHNDAIVLEHMVRSLYGCDRGGVSGMVDADYFDDKPIQAAVLIIAYLYAKDLVDNPYEYDEFLHKYETIFDYPDENDAKNEVQNYIEDLRFIIDRFALYS